MADLRRKDTEYIKYATDWAVLKCTNIPLFNWRDRSLLFGLSTVAIIRELSHPCFGAYTQTNGPITPQLRLHEVVLSEVFKHDLSTLDRLLELKKMCGFR